GFAYNIGACTETADGFDEERQWVRDFWSALEPHQTGVYVNFLGDEGQDRVRQSYGAEKYARLQKLKRRYDPENFFRINQNRPPLLTRWHPHRVRLPGSRAARRRQLGQRPSSRRCRR